MGDYELEQRYKTILAFQELFEEMLAEPDPAKRLEIAGRLRQKIHWVRRGIEMIMEVEGMDYTVAK